MSTLSPNLLEGFLIEAQGYVDEISAALEGHPQDASPADIQEMHRQWHTIVGAAEMLELQSLTDIASPAEAMLEAVVEAEEHLSDEVHQQLQSCLQQAQDELVTLNNGERPGGAAPPPVAQPSSAQSASPPDILEIFAIEAQEHLEVIEKSLLHLEAHSDDRGSISEFRRVTHTLKGASASIGMDGFARIAHLMEDLLENTLQTSENVSPDALGLLSNASDMLVRLLEPEPDGETDSLRQTMVAIEESFAEELGDLYPPPAAQPDAIVRESADLRQSTIENLLRVPQTRVDALVNRVGEIVINRAALELHVRYLSDLLSEFDHSARRLRRVTHSIDTHIRTATPDQPQEGQLGFDPLELDYYSSLYQYTRELEEVSADTQNINYQMHVLSDDIQGSVSRERRLTTELQDGLMSTRLVAFRELETRLRRTVQRTSRDLGKSVKLIIGGADVRVDKAILNTLADPLMHLLRNAVDHGIEAQEQRESAGKPAEGLLTLNVARERGRVNITLSDDGAGIDLAQVRQQAIRQGLLDKTSAFTDDQLINLIFEEQFTLSKTVSTTSGRGIGLSVVRHAARELQGTVRVSTKAGTGSIFTISVPITLAITQALFIESSGQTFAVPLDQISQVFRLEPETKVEIERDSTLRLDEENPVSTFGLSEFVLGENQLDSHGYALVIDQGDHQTAVLVDALAGTHEIVVKSLGTHLRRVSGIAGGTIAGDGRVVLILDLPEILTDDRSGIVSTSAYGSGQTTSHSPAGERRILVVDDSLSVRRIVCAFLERVGWQAVPAKDGIEALEKTRQWHFDAAIVDIEMPRMNGYELLGEIKSNVELSHIPVIFLTSRGAARHRARAEEMGVDGYLVKPYQEQQLYEDLMQVMEKS